MTSFTTFSGDHSNDEDDFNPGVTASNQGGRGWTPTIDDPAYFEAMSPEEIYDSFFRLRRMGYIANRIIRKLNEAKYISTTHILEKVKKMKLLQRKQFELLGPSGTEYLKVMLRAGKSTLDSVLRRNASQALKSPLTIFCSSLLLMRYALSFSFQFSFILSFMAV